MTTRSSHFTTSIHHNATYLNQVSYLMPFLRCLPCRSEETIAMNSWHEVRVSRTAKSGILQVDNQRPTEGKAEVRIALI